MIGLDNPIHLAFLLILLLLVFGAKRLPEMGRSLGSGMRGFKDSLNGETHDEPGHSVTEIPAPVVSPIAPEESRASPAAGEHTADVDKHIAAA